MRWKKLLRLGGFIVISPIITNRLLYKYYDNTKYSTPSSLKTSYDFIVIGGGTSGCVAAKRLCEHNSKPAVLLIEAGPPSKYHPLSTQVIPIFGLSLLESNNLSYKYYTESQTIGCNKMNENKSFWIAGKGFGGSSIVNLMAYIRGSKENYDAWCYNYKCKDWNYDNVLPYFKKIETVNLNIKHINDEIINDLNTYRGTNGPQSIEYFNNTNDIDKWKQLFIQSCNDLGYPYNVDLNGKTQNGVAKVQSNTYYGRRMTSFRSYIAPLFDNGKHNNEQYNIDIIPYSQVTKIICEKNNKNPNNNVANGIQYIYKNKSETKYEISLNNNGNVILCCGAINTPKLLMLSGIGPNDELNKHNIDIVKNIEGVGKNLMDHLLLNLKIAIPKIHCNELGLVTIGDLLNPLSLYKYLKFGTGPYTIPGGGMMLFCQSNNCQYRANDIQIGCLMNGIEPPPHMLAKLFNIKSDEIETYTNIKERNKYILQDIAMVFLLPKSRGCVTLNSSNFADPPKIIHNYVSDEHGYDLKCSVDGLQTMIDIYSSKYFQDYGVILPIPDQANDKEHYFDPIHENGLKKRVKDWTFAVFHPIGTCKMGDLASNNLNVVDHRLKLKGFDNIRIMDASIMPFAVSGNTQATCYLIAEKGAHMLLNDCYTHI